jgi:acetyltransferase-like isoleucine patch superfamily enzyme
MIDSFYSTEELNAIGLQRIGENVKISKKSSLYNPSLITIGNNVRIDDFCILSGKINLGSHIHIAAHTSLYAGDAGIEMNDFTCVSSRCVIYAISDDYSGEYLTNSTIPENYRNVNKGKVTLRKHVLIGAGSIVLPNVTLGEGSAFGAMSLITCDSQPWSINVGIPATYKK